MKSNLNISLSKFAGFFQVIRKNVGFIFVLFLVVIYGMLAWRILSLMQTEPDPTAVNAQLKTVGVPKVDEEVVRKIQQLEDNSVDVKTLFENARNNPFEE